MTERHRTVESRKPSDSTVCAAVSGIPRRRAARHKERRIAGTFSRDEQKPSRITR